MTTDRLTEHLKERLGVEWMRAVRWNLLLKSSPDDLIMSKGNFENLVPSNPRKTTWTRGDGSRHIDPSVVINWEADWSGELENYHSKIKSLKAELETETDPKEIEEIKANLEYYTDEYNRGKKVVDSQREQVNNVLSIASSLGEPVKTKNWDRNSDFVPAVKYKNYVFQTDSFPIAVYSMKKFKGLHSMKEEERMDEGAL